METVNKNQLVEKTGQYMQYIEQHKKNVCAAWKELQKALIHIDFLQRPQILDCMEWRIRCHDDSKMSEEEFVAYRRHFYPVDGEAPDEQEFERAWRIHYHRNDHHWQYWIEDNGEFCKSYNVEDKICAYLEMICDWPAMGYVFGDSAPAYYKAHKDEIKIDPDWISFVEEILSILEDYLQGEVVQDG